MNQETLSAIRLALHGACTDAVGEITRGAFVVDPKLCDVTKDVWELHPPLKLPVAHAVGIGLCMTL